MSRASGKKTAKGNEKKKVAIPIAPITPLPIFGNDNSVGGSWADEVDEDEEAMGGPAVPTAPAVKNAWGVGSKPAFKSSTPTMPSKATNSTSKVTSKVDIF